MKKRCAIYTRESIDKHSSLEFVSRKTQEKEIKSYITSQDKLEYQKSYHDEGCIEGNLNRPALKQLIKDVQQSKIDILITYRLDRLTRAAEPLYNFLKYLARKKVDFIALVDGFDNSTPFDTSTHEGKAVLDNIPTLHKIAKETFIYD